MVTRPQFPVARGASVSGKNSWLLGQTTITTPSSTSFVELARFQQKQLQEKEQKLLQLYDQQQQRAHQVAQRGSAGSNGSNGSSQGSAINSTAGKVRQIFDERRQTNVKGIDKSYPLEPLDGKSKKHSNSTVKPSVPGVNSKLGQNATTRKTMAGTKRTNKTDANSNVQTTGSRGGLAINRRESLARESYTSSRESQETISQQRENVSRESYVFGAEIHGEFGESIRQANEHARNGQRYEINIDDVIDNEAMERNRMLAKIHPVEIDRQRRFSNDIENEEFPEEMLHDVTDKVAEKSSSLQNAARKSSLQAEPRVERFKNTNTRKSNGNATTTTTTTTTTTPTTMSTTKKPTIPTGTNARQSTVMKTTKSASLKVRKLPRNRKTVEDKKKKPTLRKANQVKEKSRMANTSRQSPDCDSKKSLSVNFNSLKSTPLICEIIRNHGKVEQSSETDAGGIVKTIVKKMESTITETKSDSKTSTKQTESSEEVKKARPKILKINKPNAPSLSQFIKRGSIFNSTLFKKSTTITETSKSTLDTNCEATSTNTLSKDLEDGLISQEKVTISAARGNRESSVEQPTERPELTVADQTIKVKRDTNVKLESSKCINLVRRASFELKRMMFEQIQNSEKLTRRDSVESALRHFDSIGVDVTESTEPVSTANANKSESAESTGEKQRKESIRLCSGESLNQPTKSMKGFERHTSAWSIRTAKDKAPAKLLTNRVKEVVVAPAAGRRLASRRKLIARNGSASKKLLEARDSIELARVNVKPKSVVCRRKINLGNVNSSSETKTQQQTRTTVVPVKVEEKNDELPIPVKSQSSPGYGRVMVARLKSILGVEPSLKSEKFPSSTRTTTTRNSNGELLAKKGDSSSKGVGDSVLRKNVSPYPSSKSPDNTSEQKSRPAAKAFSLKLGSRTTGSNGDIPAASENGFSTATRKPSLTAVDHPDSPEDSRNRSTDDERPSTMAPAPRTGTTFGSTSSIGTNRSQASTTARNHPNPPKTKAPTPARRLATQAAASTNDDSLTLCKICNRRFTEERITLHEQICAKTSQKKRKQFDTVTHRVRGTELESFVQKPVTKKQSRTSKPEPEPKHQLTKSNWRRKHEDFINAIRSAKQAQAHLAAGGKLSDLPPPPPSDTSDYIQCPHCSRKFSEAAAQRHIPKCQNMQHNKPNPRAPPKPKR